MGYFPRRPIVLGHEPAGVISKLGVGVTDWAIGDRVGASVTRFTVISVATFQPTIVRANTSITKAVYAQPDLVPQ
ncbi:alcohol dehydrogenase catalytic domain-containing protein [Gordonia mangrovi]|nr:alcohol dehydrogenase catalytic domain-containing protein [Gordonia mangrovi]UVF80778.1 alcohol dehydrogenase catalytic domain-containing protein [Gordonia mangrovi]